MPRLARSAPVSTLPRAVVADLTFGGHEKAAPICGIRSMVVVTATTALLGADFLIPEQLVISVG
jgi:hypothetical protein